MYVHLYIYIYVCTYEYIYIYKCKYAGMHVGLYKFMYLVRAVLCYIELNELYTECASMKVS